LHCTFGTAYRGLVRFGKLAAGQRALITGANGGVGSAAVQVARALGAEVVAVVRDERHRDFLTELGADEVLVDTEGRFHRALRGRVHVAMDCVGQPTFNASVRSVQVGGRVVVVGNIVPERAQVNLGYLITQGIQVAGSSGANRDDMAELIALHRDKPMRMAIHERISIDGADEAQRKVQAGGLQGRIVITF
jgi:acryloyl-coenzyme A reductase